VIDRRLPTLRAALGFLQLPPRAFELRLLHRWLDTWTGIGLIVVGVERQGAPVLAESHRRRRVAGTLHQQSDVRAGGVRGGVDAVGGGAAGGVGGGDVGCVDLPLLGVTPL